MGDGAYPTLDGLFTAIRGKDVDVGFGGWTANAQFRGKGFPVSMVFPVGRGVTKGEIDAAVMFDPLADKLEGSGKFRSIGNLADAYKAGTGEDFLWIGYSTNDDFMKAEPEALKNFTRAWLEAIEYVKSHPEVFEAYGKKYDLEPKAVALLRELVLADYTTTWNEERIATLRRFGQMANEVMGDGYLDTVPAAAFSTRFDPRN